MLKCIFLETRIGWMIWVRESALGFMSKVFPMSIQFKNAFKLNSNKKKVSSESCLVDASTCTASSEGRFEEVPFIEHIVYSVTSFAKREFLFSKSRACALKVVLVHHVLQPVPQRCNPCGCTSNYDQFINKLSSSGSTTSCCT